MQARTGFSLALFLLLLAAGSMPAAAGAPSDLRPLFPDATLIDGKMEADEYQEYDLALAGQAIHKILEASFYQDGGDEDYSFVGGLSLEHVSEEPPQD